MNGTPNGDGSAPGNDGHSADQHPGAHHFVQAPIRPLDEDGVTATIVGTIGFAVATVVLVVLRSRLDAAGHRWWVWVGVVGTALGVVGYAYCRRRAARGA